MADWAAKRFWKEATVAPTADGFAVHLDGRPVRTPAKAPLIVPTQAFANLIAVEWNAQDGKIDPETMPATRSANVAIDRVDAVHAEVVTMLADYADSDLLCYRAVYPDALIEKQKAAWDPLLEWVAAEFDAPLETRVGVMHVPQKRSSLDRLHAVVDGMSAFELAAFHDLVSLSGSFVIGLAATRNVQPIDALWTISRVDEMFQSEQWGDDEEAAEDAAIKRASFLNAHKFFHAIQK